MALVTALTGTALAAENDELLSASISKTKARIGDALTLTVDFSYPSDRTSSGTPSLNVHPLSNRDENKSTWTLLSQPQVNKRENAGKIWETHRYTISAYDLGKTALPNVDLIFPATHDTSETVVQASLPEVTIEHELSGSTDFLPMKPPITVPLPKWLTYLAAVIGIGILLLAVWTFLRFFRRKIAAVISPPLTPEEWALRELDKLKNEQLVETKQFKVFFTRLSDTLRQYTQVISDIPAMDLTTDELLERLGESTVREEAVELLKTALSEADLVKFAKFVPENRQCAKSVDRAKEFVELTRPLRQQPQQQENASCKQG